MAEEWTISEEEWDRRQQDAHSATEKAMDVTPERSSWGLFSYTDAPMAGYTGVFCWFKAQADLLDYVKRHLTFVAPGRSDIDPGRVVRDTQNLIDAMGSEPVLDVFEAQRLELNKILRTFSQVEWWGTFGDLLQGNHPYAKQVREWFRDDDDEDAVAARPIDDDEIDDFRDAIEQYGF
jgi:hypothetical protein